MNDLTDDFSHNLDQTGQHYMIDKSIIAFITENADLEKTDVVLEIGYGKGALTKSLASKCKLIAVDIEKNEFELKHVKFVQGNILNLFNELYAKYHFNKIVANIPYNISEPLMKILFKNTQIESIVLTIGKNFVDILMKNDTRIGIIANYLYDIELLKIVKPKSFHPQPRVDSVIIKLEPKSDKLSKIYSQLVLFDDKKLKNALASIFSNKTKREVKTLTTRPLFNKKLYELSNKEFLELDEILYNIIN
jgi:16S rRNA (adenine1518-N6/adenine1519-N6)-dimethyltransferase